MENFTDIWNNAMGIGTIIMMLVGLVFIYVLIFPKDGFSKSIASFVAKHILLIGFLISIAALFGSQIYEHVIGYPPCLLCWYARIAIYPQVILYGIALYKKERVILPYAMSLTIAGLIISGYHSVVTVVGESPLPCSIGGVSCLTRFVYQFGFISIPLMVFVCFAFLFLSALVAKKAAK